MKNKLPFLFTSLLTIALAAGCGGNGQQTEVTGGSETPAANESASGSGSGSATESQPDDASAREVVIEANDQMKFDIGNFDVQAGETIRIVLKNVGTMPKASMGHNVVVLDQGVDVDSFAEDATMAAANDYIPQDREDEIIAHTAMLGGGEEDSVTFTVPEQTGEYVFICSFPGHYQIGMKGTMTVQ